METRQKLREMLLLAFDGMPDVEIAPMVRMAQSSAKRNRLTRPLLRLIVGDSPVLICNIAGVVDQVKNK